jgi:hypothetical protein
VAAADKIDITTETIEDKIAVITVVVIVNIVMISYVIILTIVTVVVINVVTTVVIDAKSVAIKEAVPVITDVRIPIINVVTDTKRAARADINKILEADKRNLALANAKLEIDNEILANVIAILDAAS